MNELQADALINEIHELNKTLKTISSSLERVKFENDDIKKVVKPLSKTLSFSDQVGPRLL